MRPSPAAAVLGPEQQQRVAAAVAVRLMAGIAGVVEPADPPVGHLRHELVELPARRKRRLALEGPACNPPQRRALDAPAVEAAREADRDGVGRRLEAEAAAEAAVGERRRLDRLGHGSDRRVLGGPLETRQLRREPLVRHRRRRRRDGDAPEEDRDRP